MNHATPQTVYINIDTLEKFQKYESGVRAAQGTADSNRSPRFPRGSVVRCKTDKRTPRSQWVNGGDVIFDWLIHSLLRCPWATPIGK